jgi:hypothetical protein
VTSVDAVAKLLEVRYADCSPGQSVEWLSYRNNHDLAFLPHVSQPLRATTSARLATVAADVPAVSASLGTRRIESGAMVQFGQHTVQLERAPEVTSSMTAGDCPAAAPAVPALVAACEPAAPAASASAVASVPAAAAPAVAASSASASICIEEISLLDSDEEEGVVTTRTVAAPSASTAVTLIGSDSDGSGHDDQEGEEGEVVVKGASASDYPHARCNCTLRRFHSDTIRTPATDKQNATTCKNWCGSNATASILLRCRTSLEIWCRSYCLVCDVLASECSRWEDPVERDAAEYSSDGATPLTIAKTSHCLADDKAEKWKRTRQAGKHDWLKESPLYTHLGTQCYGASADYFAVGSDAFEGFNVSFRSPRCHQHERDRVLTQLGGGDVFSPRVLCSAHTRCANI